ncbi:MAG: TetR/AcrR family transcriptional regulator [Bacteroidota bacterium]
MSTETPPKKRKRGRPSQKNTLDKELLLREALKVFAEFGFEGTSVKTIATRLQIDDSLIFYHYQTKQNLWHEAMRFITHDYEEKAKETVRLCKDQAPIDIGKMLTRQLIYYASENVELYKIMMHEMTQKSDRSDWIIDHILKPLDERIRPVLEAYKAEGYEVNMPMYNYISINFGILTTFFLMDNLSQRLYGVDVYAPEEIERHADTAIEIIYSSLFRRK